MDATLPFSTEWNFDNTAPEGNFEIIRSAWLNAGAVVEGADHVASVTRHLEHTIRTVPRQ